MRKAREQTGPTQLWSQGDRCGAGATLVLLCEAEGVSNRRARITLGREGVAALVLLSASLEERDGNLCCFVYCFDRHKQLPRRTRFHCLESTIELNKNNE